MKKKIVNNPLYGDRGTTATKSGDVVKITTQTYKVIKTVYQKQITAKFII